MSDTTTTTTGAKSGLSDAEEFAIHAAAVTRDYIVRPHVGLFMSTFSPLLNAMMIQW